MLLLNFPCKLLFKFTYSRLNSHFNRIIFKLKYILNFTASNPELKIL